MPLPREYATVPRQEADRSPGNLEDLRVLLVEDEPNTREATRVLLENHGAHVQVAESAAAAREAYKLQPPDIIVSDIGLPGEDGVLSDTAHPGLGSGTRTAARASACVDCIPTR
jgi:PleD family two-component response regulator